MNIGSALNGFSKGWDTQQDRDFLNDKRNRALRDSDLNNKMKEYKFGRQKQKDAYNDKKRESMLAMVRDKYNKVAQSHIDTAILGASRGDMSGLRNSLTNTTDGNYNAEVKGLLESHLGGQIVDVMHRDEMSPCEGGNCYAADTVGVKYLTPQGEMKETPMHLSQLGAMVGTHNRVGAETFNEHMSGAHEPKRGAWAGVAAANSINFDGTVSDLKKNLGFAAVIGGDPEAQAALDAMAIVGAKDTSTLSEAIATAYAKEKDPQKRAELKKQLQSAMKSKELTHPKKPLEVAKEGMMKALQEGDIEKYKEYEKLTQDLQKKPAKAGKEAIRQDIYDTLKGKVGAVKAGQEASSAVSWKRLKPKEVQQQLAYEAAKRGDTKTMEMIAEVNRAMKGGESAIQSLQRRVLSDNPEEVKESIRLLQMTKGDKVAKAYAKLAYAKANNLPDMMEGAKQEIRAYAKPKAKTKAEVKEDLSKVGVSIAGATTKGKTMAMYATVKQQLAHSDNLTPEQKTKLEEQFQVLEEMKADYQPQGVKQEIMFDKAKGKWDSGDHTAHAAESVISHAGTIAEQRATAKNLYGDMVSSGEFDINSKVLLAGRMDEKTKAQLDTLDKLSNTAVNTASASYKEAKGTMTGVKLLGKATQTISNLKGKLQPLIDAGLVSENGFVNFLKSKTRDYMGSDVAYKTSKAKMDDIQNISSMGREKFIKKYGMEKYNQTTQYAKDMGLTDIRKMNTQGFLAMKAMLKELSGMGVTNVELKTYSEAVTGGDYVTLDSMAEHMRSALTAQITTSLSTGYEGLNQAGAYKYAVDSVQESRKIAQDVLSPYMNPNDLDNLIKVNGGGYDVIPQDISPADQTVQRGITQTVGKKGLVRNTTEYYDTLDMWDSFGRPQLTKDSMKGIAQGVVAKLGGNTKANRDKATRMVKTMYKFAKIKGLNKKPTPKPRPTPQPSPQPSPQSNASPRRAWGGLKNADITTSVGWQDGL